MVMSAPLSRGLSRTRVAAVVATVLALVAPVTARAATAADAAGPVMYPSGVGADLGPTPTTLGVTPRAGDNAAGLQTGTVLGRAYWKTNIAADTRYFVFELAGEYVDNLTSNDITVSLTYLDEGTGTLALRDETGVDPAPRAELPLTDTGQWTTRTVALPGMTFADPAGFRVELAPGTPDRDFSVSSIRVGSVGAHVELGASPMAAGISPRAGDNESGLVTGVLDGRSYWQTNHAAPSPATTYFYMNVADTFAYDTHNRVLVSVDYFDEGSGQFRLQYDSPGDEIGDKFKNSEVVTYGEAKVWKTYTFTLDDAVLTNRSNGSDFRISTDGAGELKVASVRVAIVAANLDATEGLRNLIDTAERTYEAAREGDRDGQYPAGSRATLAAAIAHARQLAGDPDATEAEIVAELHALSDAHEAFKAKVIDTNLARGKPVTASSAADGAGPDLAVDGDGDTAWTSGSSTGDEWLRVDLGTARPLNEVRVAWGSPPPSDYTVEVSADGVHYTTVGRNGATGTSTVRSPFETRTARYVRLGITGFATEDNHVSVREFEVRDRPVVRPDSRLVTTRYPTDDRVIADFDASRYGADATGAKDSTAAIQQALYDCLDAGGGTVWLPAGTYRVTDTLEVHAFCTLRGDRRDPDHGHGSYGTVVVADLPPGDDGPTLFRIGGSAGLMGITTYYPHQSASDPVPYNYTFEIPGGAWIGPENYMMATISDVTMLNSYRGIGISTMPSDSGGAPGSGQVHESSTIRNVKGTALLEGMRAYNGADVGTWENVVLSNAYWAGAGSAYHAPNRATLDAWTRGHGTAFALGDLEWEQLYGLQASDYQVGIKIVPGQRISFAGSFLATRIRRTDVALDVESFDSRWGLVFSSGMLEGSAHAVQNKSDGFVKLTGTEVVGDTQGTVHVLSGQPPTYDQQPLPGPARAKLYDVSKQPFGAPRGVGYLPATDATAQIQRALDKAAADGGGIVYLPAGWYRIGSRLRVPANVELRGASAVPNRDQLGASGGTVLLAYEGRSTSEPDTAPALVTLEGAHAGVRGLRVFYPENNPATADGLVPYPYAIRAKAAATYVVNVGLPNAWNGIDMSSPHADHFVVRKIAGAVFSHVVTVGANHDGRIEGLLSNGNAVTRVGFALPHWANEGSIFPQVIDKYMRKQSQLVTVDGASRLTVFDVFGYGFHNGLVVDSGSVTAYGIGTDNLGDDGHTVQVADDGDVTATNVLRYNGSTLAGPARLYNMMAINMVQHAVSANASPAAGGTVNLAGNETEPGRYEAGSHLTATARAAEGYAFQHWTVDGTVLSDEPTLTVTVSADQVLTAVFTPST